jgi:hypothetical protein
MKRVTLIVLLIFASLLLTGCLPGDGKNTEENPAGFFWGVWHGWMAPISLIIGLFRDNVRVYETANTGWWYDLGFYVAVVGGFGGISLVRKKTR